MEKRTSTETRTLASVTLVNETKGHIFSEFTEPIDDDTTTGEAYRMFQREYGRCVGRMYRDTSDAGTIAVGWVFQKRMTYDDCNETYLREAWCAIRTETVEVAEWYTPVA